MADKAKVLKTVVAVASLGLVPAHHFLRDGKNPLTLEALRAAYPRLSAADAARYLRPLNQALREGALLTPRRAAAFLAQLGHESGELRYWEELASGADYENRKDLGNTQPGDGVRFKGRGPIQLTGRANYRAAGAALGLPLEEQPELVATVDVGFRVAVWFWNSRKLSALADLGTLEAFRTITLRINGGQNGAADREAKWATAKAVLGDGT
ncbi:glycoside hydrolase family 19 protein [Stigmatella erecta]|uniref:Putative chitinase n=1 Tax=Stigmatella erecta TaxID=83460 RepID=A0A1I0LA10_9BACT|nr:glycoside hydrolase family 19 protein [Stigmatella erecta]SEU36965.1 putative chitinase [Stigmatella erecta]